jgi:hypothetical protein
MARQRYVLAAAAVLPLLVGCATLGDLSSNLACGQVGAAEASAALQREVEAEPSPIEGFFVTCEYYPPGRRQALAGLSLYTEDAKTTYEAERASFAEGPAQTKFRDEDIGVPAYSRIEPDVALAGALDGDRYYMADVIIDRYDETAEVARAAAVRLLQAAVEGY